MSSKPSFCSCSAGYLSCKSKSNQRNEQVSPDFRATKQDLASIFATIQQYGHFPTPDDLIDEFEE
jgi:hypothetical protein